MSAPKSKEVKAWEKMTTNSFYGFTQPIQNRAYHNFSLKNVEEITVAGREHLAKLKEQMEPIKLEQNS
jgi:hypothetical protein